MKLIFAFATFILLLESQAFAQKITLIPLTNETDYSPLSSDHVQVKQFDEITPPEPNTLLLPSERDTHLRDLGLSQEIKNLDDLDRDQLLWTLYHKGAHATHLKFPLISEKKLQKASERMDQ